MSTWIKSALLITSLLMLPTSALGEAPQEPGPRERLEAAYTTIAEVTAKVKTQEELVSELTAKMSEVLDYKAFAARTLKGRWKKLNSAQKKRFTKHFKELLLRTYSKRFKPQTTFEVAYRGDTHWLGEDKALGEVHTTVTGKRAAADVSYLFARDGRTKAWRIVDITIDEVSMAQNWRRQFLRVMDKEGFASLVNRIRSKADASSSKP